MSEKFEPVEIGQLHLDLNNTDRRMLATMAEPGGPLWKIIHGMLDYASGLSASLVNADFKTESGREVAFEIQASARAAVWTVNTLTAAMTPLEEETPNDGH